MCSDQLPKESDGVEPSELQHANDARRVSDILQFTTESTPPPKSDDAAETNGSSKQTRKSKRPQWLTVGVIQHCYHTHTHPFNGRFRDYPGEPVPKR